MGLTFATLIGRAAAARSHLTVFARGDSLAALKEHGLRLECPRGQYHHVAVDGHEVAATSLEGYDGAAFDVVLLCVKGNALDATLIQQLKPLLVANTALCTAQNGIPFWFSPLSLYGDASNY